MECRGIQVKQRCGCSLFAIGMEQRLFDQADFKAAHFVIELTPLNIKLLRFGDCKPVGGAYRRGFQYLSLRRFKSWIGYNIIVESFLQVFHLTSLGKDTFTERAGGDSRTPTPVEERRLTILQVV